jgi:hypothetical protein
LANQVKSVRTATEPTIRCSEAYFVGNYSYRSVVVIGVVKHKVPNRERRYPKVLKHRKDDLSYPITSISAY